VAPEFRWQLPEAGTAVAAASFTTTLQERAMCRAKWVVFVAGVVVGAVLAVVGVDRLPRADAQQPAAKPADAGRYQVSAYGTGTANLYGAYVVDTATGEVFHCRETNAPKPLGKAEKK
jgi:hypothetical protein